MRVECVLMKCENVIAQSLGDIKFFVHLLPDGEAQYFSNKI